MFGFGNRHGARPGSQDIDGVIPITQLQNGQSGTVSSIAGGQGVKERLMALGIRQGQKITRIGGMFLKGPVTVQLNKGQVAIGFGMAKNILVKTENENPIDG